MSIKDILTDLDAGMKNKDIAEKYVVSPAFITQVKQKEIVRKKLEIYDVLMSLIDRDALKAYGSKMSEREKEIWASL